MGRPITRKHSDAIRRYQRRRFRTGRSIHGTAERPRMSVYRSNNHIYVQLVDDDKGHTLAAASSVALKTGGGNIEGAKAVGKAIAGQALAASIERVVFDRNGRLYHGRVKALADAAREGGLKF